MAETYIIGEKVSRLFFEQAHVIGIGLYLSLSFADLTERALRRAQFARQCVYRVVGGLTFLGQRVSSILHLSV